MWSPTSSPRTPTRRRHTLFSLESIKTSPSSSRHPPQDASSGQSSTRRRSSITGPRTPYTPTNHLRSSQGLNDSARMSAGAVNGLGSLADELADAWDEDGEGDETMGQESWVEKQSDGCDDYSSVLYSHDTPNDRLDFTPSPRKEALENGSRKWSRHHRKASKCQRSILDEEDDEDDANEISSALEARLAEISTLAQKGLDSMNDLQEEEDDNIFDRITTHLQDLGSQTDIETSTTRLINAHNSLTNHLTQQTRHIQTLTYPLLSPLTSSVLLTSDPDLIPSTLLDPLLASLPHRQDEQPQPQPLTLTPLSDLTTDLLQTLTQLSDSLHMARQSTTQASRRLKTARDITAEIIRDDVVLDKAIRWIEDGRWEEKLAARQCGQTCREVVSGFEDVCMSWRERIVVGLGSAAAGAGGDLGPVGPMAKGGGGEVEPVAS